MDDFPKYKYTKPKTAGQRIEAIYEQFVETPKLLPGSRPVETLKDVLMALLARARAWDYERENAREAVDAQVNRGLVALVALTLIFLVLATGNAEDSEWLQENQFALRLWGSAFAAIYVGISIERTSIFRTLWSFGFTKFVASVAFSALVIFSTGKASAVVNSVFGVDASALPFTRAFMAGFIAFDYLSLVLAAVGAFALLHALNLLSYINSLRDKDASYEHAPWGSIAALLVGMIVLGFTMRWVNVDFSHSALPAKAYRLAHVLDFNAKHSCANVHSGLPVVFIGAAQDKVLVDAQVIVTDNVESFVRREKSDEVSVPPNFELVRCAPSDRVANR